MPRTFIKPEVNELQFLTISNLVPEKYKSSVTKSYFLERIVTSYQLLTFAGITITKIVPFCLDEFIYMNRDDLRISNLSSPCEGKVDIQKINKIYGFKCLDGSGSGVALETDYVGNVQFNVPHPYVSLSKEEGNLGFSLVSDTNSNKLYNLNRFNNILLPKQHDDYIFKVQSRNVKKIETDVVSYQFLKEVLTNKELGVVNKNFINNNTEPVVKWGN